MIIKKLIVGSLNTNCYLMASNKESAIIDPGGKPGLILKELQKISANLKYIILTHGHPDHIGAVEEIKNKTEAKLLFHREEVDFIPLQADRLLKEGGKIKIGKEMIKIIHTPGHTPGSICLLGVDFIFTGDTIFQQGYGRTDLEGGSWKDLKVSLQKINQILKPGMKVHPGHGPSFTIHE